MSINFISEHVFGSLRTMRRCLFASFLSSSKIEFHYRISNVTGFREDGGILENSSRVDAELFHSDEREVRF